MVAAPQPLTLKTALATYGHTAALKDGRISADGIAFEFVEHDSIIAAFRRMVRETAFDVCEMSPTTYLAAKMYHKPFTALPIFLNRVFHDGALVAHTDAGLQSYKDFEDKRVGVRAYTVATGVWVRGLLQDAFGVTLNRVTWVTDDEEHVTEYTSPDYVQASPQGKSLRELLDAGELAASFTGAAGIGRVEPVPHLSPLTPDIGATERERYKETGIFPIHGVIVVKDSVLQAHPWVAKSLFDAFKAAKEGYLKELTEGEPASPRDQMMVQRKSVVGDDPIPYGIAQNQRSLEAMVRYAYDQGLISRALTIEEIFDPTTLNLA